MAKKTKIQYCKHGAEQQACGWCRYEELRTKSESVDRTSPATVAELADMVAFLLDRCSCLESELESVKDQLPPEYDPQWE